MTFIVSPHMTRTLALAESALYITMPNPRVGCVLVNSEDMVIGEGHTQKAGEAHAEIMALRDAAMKGHTVKGATAYVTLEPCNHQGRTGPCTQALIQAGVHRVVASIQDPNPLVAGQGFTALRAAGVEVQIGDGAQQSQELNIGFFKRMQTGLPWVRMKAATSLDGLTALPNGQSQWITGEAARTDGHAWRARACAVLTGIGTVLVDDPRLDVRHVVSPRTPILILVDSNLDLPLTAKLLNPTAPLRQIWVYTTHQHPDKTDKIKFLQKLGVEVISLPSVKGKVDLAAMLLDLGRRQINELHVEAGFKLNGSLLREGLVDELLLYQSAQLLGQGLGIVNIGPFTQLAEAPKLRYHSVDHIGSDLRILARKYNINQ